MTVALAFESDDGSRAIQTRVEVTESDGMRAEDCCVSEYYAVERTIVQLRAGAFRKIALQFPDSLLPDAPEVQQALKDGLEGHFDLVFVLGDTSYGSCCVDEVAAQHLSADCIVHYGRTCLSATTHIPVIYVFGNAPIDVDDCAQQLGAQMSHVPTEKTIVLLYEPRFHHARYEILSALKQDHGERRLVLGEMNTFYDPKQIRETGSGSEDRLTEGGHAIYRVGGQRVVLPSDADLTSETTAFVYVGAESAHLTSILLRYSSLDCFSYDPSMQSVRKEGVAVNKALMRRFFLVQQAKEAQIFGILMGTLGVSKYLDVVHSLQRLIKASGRKSYLFVVGKLNVPKLANYAEIDAFVLVACQQNSLMDSKEFYKPIVTPYELQLALSERDEWTGELATDFREVLPAIAQTTSELEASTEGNDDESDAPFFSLVSGTYQTKSVSRAAAANVSLALENGGAEASMALQTKNEHSELTTYRSEAAEFLSTREYRGLDPRLGETPAHAAVEGSTGIARGYDHEH